MTQQSQAGMERRVFARLPYRIPCEFTYDGSKLAGIVTDISARGLFVETSNRIPIGTELQLVLRDPRGSFEVVGRVMRERRSHRSLRHVRASGLGIQLDGHCRVGVFKQPMSALITRAGGTYKGKFLDGAAGKGLDILSGKVSGDKVVVAINRQKLNGALVARLQDENTMNITISVKVEDKMIPVIGMSLNRKVDTMAVGSIK